MKKLVVDYIPLKWSTQVTMKKVNSIIKGHCEFEKFIRSKHPGCKTMILTCSESLIKISEAISRLNAAGYESQIMKSKMSAVERFKPKENYKLDTEFPIYQVFMKVHREVMMELLRKYQSLYELDIKCNKRLISLLARVIFDRLTDIIEMETFTNAYALSVAYRQMHPHLSDYELVQGSMIEVGGKPPRSESELVVPQKSMYLINRIPADQVMAVCNKYSEKITKTVRSHIGSLDAEILPGDTGEEVAKKKVRAQLKKLDPYVNIMMKQIIHKHFFGNKVRGDSVVIQGEPSLPSWKAMMKILWDFQPFTNVRYLLCNVCAFDLSPKHYGALLAMDGTVYNPDNLSKQDLNQIKPHSLSQLALNIVNAVRQENKLFEDFLIKTSSDEYNVLLTELGLDALVKDQSSATPEVCLNCVYKSVLGEVQGTVFSSDCDETDAGKVLKDYDALLTESDDHSESLDENDLVDLSVDDDIVDYDIDLTQEDILLGSENETDNNTSKSLCQNNSNNEKNGQVESPNKNPIGDHSNADDITKGLASLIHNIDDSGDSGTEMVNLECDSDCVEIDIVSEIKSPDLEVVEQNIRDTESVARVSSVVDEIEQSIQDIDAEIAKIRARHTSTENADDSSACKATDQFIARLDAKILSIRERIAQRDDSIVIDDTISNEDGNLCDLITLPDYTDDLLENEPDVIDIVFVENYFSQEVSEIHEKLQQTDQGQIGTHVVVNNKVGNNASESQKLVSASNENTCSTSNKVQDVCQNPVMEQDDLYAGKTLNDKNVETEKQNKDSVEMETTGPTSDLCNNLNDQMSTEMQIDNVSYGNVQMTAVSAYEMKFQEFQDQCPINEIVADPTANITGELNSNVSPVEMYQASTTNNIISNEMIVDEAPEIVQTVIADKETHSVVTENHIEPNITIIQYDQVGKNMNKHVAKGKANDDNVSDTFTDQDDDCFIVEAPERSIIVISDSDDETEHRENKEKRTNTQTIRIGSDANENRQTSNPNSNNGTVANTDMITAVTNNQPRKRKNQGQDGNNFKRPNFGHGVVNVPRMSSMNQYGGVTNRFYQPSGPPNDYNRYPMNNYNRFTMPNIHYRPQQYNNPYPFNFSNQSFLQQNFQYQQYNGVYNALSTYMSYHMQTQNQNNAGINTSFQQYYKKYESRQNSNNQTNQNSNNQTNLPNAETNEGTKKKKRNRKNKKFPQPKMVVKKERLNTSNRNVQATASKQVNIKKEK